MFQLLGYDCQSGDIRLQRHNEEHGLREKWKWRGYPCLGEVSEVAVHDIVKLNPCLVYVVNAGRILSCSTPVEQLAVKDKIDILGRQPLVKPPKGTCQKK